MMPMRTLLIILPFFLGAISAAADPMGAPALFSLEQLLERRVIKCAARQGCGVLLAHILVRAHTRERGQREQRWQSF